MMPAAAARVRVGVSREAESGVSVKLRDCAVDEGDDLPDVRDGTRLTDADRRFRALRELVGDGRPDAGGRELDSHSEAEQSVSSNMVNSASVMSALRRLLTGGTIVVAECEDSGEMVCVASAAAADVELDTDGMVEQGEGGSGAWRSPVCGFWVCHSV